MKLETCSTFPPCLWGACMTQSHTPKEFFRLVEVDKQTSSAARGGEEEEERGFYTVSAVESRCGRGCARRLLWWFGRGRWQHTHLFPMT